MSAKKNIVVYKEGMQSGEGLENLKSKELENHKTGCADRNNNSENKKYHSDLMVLRIDSAGIGNQSGNSDSAGNDGERFPYKNTKCAVKNVVSETNVILKRLFKKNHRKGRENVKNHGGNADVKVSFFAA